MYQNNIAGMGCLSPFGGPARRNGVQARVNFGGIVLWCFWGEVNPFLNHTIDHMYNRLPLSQIYK